MMSILLCFLCFLPIFIVSFFIFSRKQKPSKWKLPPSPSSLPIIGNLHHLNGQIHRCIHKLCIQYGSVMYLRLGSLPLVVISSSEAAEEMLKTHDLECSSRAKSVATEKLSYGYKDIGFGPYGEYWREMKKLAIIELFSLKKVRSFRPVREEEVELMIKKVHDECAQSPVDLTKTFSSLTTSIICRVALGQNFHDSEFIDQEKIKELISEVREVLGGFTFTDFFGGGFGRSMDWLFGKHKKLNKVFKELDAFYQHVIDDHLKKSSEGKASDYEGDIVSLMLDLIRKQKKEDYFQLDIDNIKGVLMNIFLAGADTIAITMIWTMTELARNPRVMKKVQEEIRTTLGPRKKTIREEDLGKVDYLQLIIKETFRLHPPNPVLLRQTTPHVKIQGYDIPPNTPFEVNVWTIGRDPKRWTDPEDFIPERFEDSSIDFRGHNFDLLPFGVGRRMCPAIPLSVATIELTLLNMLYYFDWRLPYGMKIEDIDMEDTGILAVTKKLPLMLVPVQQQCENCKPMD